MPVHGKNATVRIDSTVGGDLASITADVIGPGVDFPREQETIETTSLGDDSRTYAKGMKSATLSMELDYNDTLVEILELHYNNDTDTATCSFEYKPDGSNTYEFEAILQSYNTTSPIGLNTVSTEWQVTGDVSKTA